MEINKENVAGVFQCAVLMSCLLTWMHSSKW